jgi:hypothetical protein
VCPRPVAGSFLAYAAALLSIAKSHPVQVDNATGNRIEVNPLPWPALAMSAQAQNPGRPAVARSMPQIQPITTQPITGEPITAEPDWRHGRAGPNRNEASCGPHRQTLLYRYG